MPLYTEILDHVGGNPKAAGDLHETIWEKLLRREDPRFHNVRVTRGDGGIDGFILKDPVLGSASVFQAKFYDSISSDKHKTSIVEAFVRAHSHKFRVVDWFLLLPVAISHKELDWLIAGGLKEEAKKKIAEDRYSFVDNCGISVKVESHLQDLCIRHIDIVSEHLPKSSLALSVSLAEERDRANHLQIEIADRLRIINQGMIRQRQVDLERAYNALLILNQGWGDHYGMLKYAKRNRMDLAKVEQLAAELESFSERRFDHALIAEGMCEGSLSAVTGIYNSARMLRSLVVQSQIKSSIEPEMWAHLDKLVSDINDLQRTIGEVLRTLTMRSVPNKTLHQTV